MPVLPAPTRLDLIEWATGLDLEPTISRLRTSDRRWPRHVAREIAVEYRRYLVLRWAYPEAELVPGCLLREFDRVAREVADVAPDGLAALPPIAHDAVPSTREDIAPLYEETFARPVPETWFTEDLDKFLGSSQPGIVG